MALTTEELINPRVKVIANYPNSPFEIGDILHFEFAMNGKLKLYVSQRYIIGEIEVDECPAIFEPLPWWADRDKSELPEYVKCTKHTDCEGEVFKVESYEEDGVNVTDDYIVSILYQDEGLPMLEPATQEDYENYIKSKNGNVI